MVSIQGSIIIHSKKFHEIQRIISEEAQEIVIGLIVMMDDELLKKAVLPYGDKARIYSPGFAVNLVRRTLIKVLNNYQDN